MGAVMSAQSKMAESQKMMVARQMEMQQQMRERMMAAQVAGTRDLVRFFGTFFCLATAGLIAGAVKTKNPKLLAPLLPMSFVLAYQVRAIPPLRLTCSR